MGKKLFLLLVCIICADVVWAQEMYLSISGRSSNLISGDTRSQYDIWLKPERSSGGVNIQIFDAGYGGAVDFITGDGVTTTTTYYLYRFDDLYSFNGSTVSAKSGAPTPLAELVAKDEERFKTRWVSLNESTLPGSGNGYILRAIADDGDDMNGYNVRISKSGGGVALSDEWSIISIDLSVALYRSSAQKFFQLKPYNEELPLSTTLTTAGEEDSRITKIDAFGTQYPVAEAVEDMEMRVGLENNWGLNISGSSDWLNTMTVYGQNEPVLWKFNPIVIDLLVKPEITITDEPTRRCTEHVFELTSNTLSPQTMAEAKWAFNDDIVAEGLTPTIAFTDRGDNNIRILIPNRTSYFPAYWVYNQEVFINTPPVAKLDIPKEIVSPGEEIIISAENSYDQEGKPLTYTWLVNGIRRGDTGSTFLFGNTISGNYSISVQVSDGGRSPNCSNAQKISNLRVNTQPYAEISFPEVVGTGATFAASVKNDNDADADSLSFYWFGNGVVDSTSGRSVQLTPEESGQFSLALVVDDGTGSSNSQYTTNLAYEVNASPIARFNIPAKAAPGDIITLNGSGSSDPNQDPLAFEWLVNGDFVSDSNQTDFVFPAPGDYQVSLKVNDQQGVSNSMADLVQNIHINAAPNPIIDAMDLSPVSTVDFSATQSSDVETEITSYLWDFGDGNTGSGPQISHTYQNSGSYLVKLSVDDGEGLSNSVRTIEKQVSVNSHPIASFTVPDVVAPGEAFMADGSTSSDAEGVIASYEWFLDDQLVGNEPTVNLTIPDDGTHTLTLRVRDDSGFEDAQGVLTKAIKVNIPPVAKWFTNPATVEPDRNVQFIATDSYDPDGSVTDYVWVFEDTTLSGLVVERNFRDGGTKRFELQVTDNANVANSTTVIQGEVAVNHQPYIITESFIRTNNLRVKLDASESYDLNDDLISFEWTLPDGSKRNDANFTWTAPGAGIHIISLTVDDGLGLSNSQNSESIQLQVNSPVKAVVDSVISSCTGQTVLFNSSRSFDPDGDAFNVKWTFGDGNSSETPNPSYRYEEPGNYTATLMLHDGFSADTSFTKIPVIIEGSPIAKMQVSETTVCVNSRVSFDGSESSDPSGSLPSFSWDLGDGSTQTGSKVDHVFTQPGTYNITLTVEGSGSGNCSNIAQASAVVNVVAGPVADFELPEWVIPNEEVSLDGAASTADGGFRSAIWTIQKDSTIETLEGITQNYAFREAGDYTITLDLVTNTETTCNRVSLTKTLKVNAAPVVVLSVPETNVLGTDIVLDGTDSYDPDGFIASYNWYFDGDLISTNASEIYKLTKPGFHSVRLVIADNSGATNRQLVKEQQIFVNSAPEPVIETPARLFQNESITLTTPSMLDADGDILKSTWFIDGVQTDTPVIQISDDKSYRVVLVQNDGRGLSNSVDSAVVNLFPRSHPEITPTYPPRIVIGGRLQLSGMNVGANIGFINGALFDNSWLATNLGETSFEMGWKPDNVILYKQSYSIMVEEALRFTQPIDGLKITWNPANPKTQLIAPEVNRLAADVLYTWKQGDKIIGYGKRIEVPITQGVNSFTLEVNDQKVAYSTPISTTIAITAE